jgi:hypothetical protein
MSSNGYIIKNAIASSFIVISMMTTPCRIAGKPIINASFEAKTVPPVATKDLCTTLSTKGKPIF